MGITVSGIGLRGGCSNVTPGCRCNSRRRYGTVSPCYVKLVIELTGNDEITDVARAMQHYLSEILGRENKLKEVQSVLEQRVADRTAQLEKQRSRSYRLLDHLPGFVFLHDRRQRIVYTNNQLRELYPDRALDTCYAVFQCGADCSECPRPRDMLPGQPRQWLWNGPGERLFEVYSLAFEQAGGERLIMESGLDVTERLRDQSAAHQAREELLHVSRNNDLGQLAATLAHELNQPLTGILSRAQAGLRFLAHSPANLQEVREALQGIIDNDRRASVIIQRLRTMLKRDGLRRRRIDINELIREISDLIRSDLIRSDMMLRKMQFDLLLQEDLPLLKGDPVQLQQALLNPIRNAADANEAQANPGGSIQVSSRLNEKGDIEVSIRDCGEGIDIQKLDEVFQPFKTGKPDGLGMGLPITRTIIELHQGKLAASANEDVGMTFSFTLPLDTGESDG